MSAPIVLRRALGFAALATWSVLTCPAAAQDVEGDATDDKTDAPKEEGGAEPSAPKDDARPSDEATDKGDASVEAHASVSTDALALGAAAPAGPFRRLWLGV